MNYKTGEIVRGTVSGIQPYGAFIKIDEETTGLVHISEISNGYVKNIEDFIQIDKEYSFFVLEYDESSKHAKLSFKKVNDADKVKRKPSIHRPHIKSLEEYSNFFNETLEVVTKNEKSIENIDINVESEDEINFEFDPTELNNFPNTMLEKDVLKIQQLSFDDRNNLDYLIVLCDNDTGIRIKSFIELYHGIIYEKVFFIRRYNSSSYISSILEKITNKVFKVVTITDEDQLDQLAIYRVLKQKFIDEHQDLDYKEHFYFFIGPNVKETKDLINKENYHYFEEQQLSSIINIISFSTLYVLSFARFEVFSFINGYRKALIDVSNDNTIIKKLLSIKGNPVHASCYFDHYLHLLNLSNIRVECVSPRLIIPHFKDNLKTIREYEGKNLVDVLKESNCPRIILHNSDSYSIGYLSYILIYTSLVKQNQK